MAPVARKEPALPRGKYESGYMQCMKKLHADMLSLLEDGNYSDVKISCKGVIFRAHRAILIPRCDFFRACFDNSWKEGKNDVVLLDDDDPDALRMALQEIYTRSPSIVRDHFSTDEAANFSTLVQTWKIAEKYELPHLTQQCLAYLQTEKGRLLLQDRSRTQWIEHILLGLSDTIGMRTSKQGGNFNTEMRDELKEILFLSTNLADMKMEEEKILQADSELAIELLKHATRNSPHKWGTDQEESQKHHRQVATPPVEGWVDQGVDIRETVSEDEHAEW